MWKRGQERGGVGTQTGVVERRGVGSRWGLGKSIKWGDTGRYEKAVDRSSDQKVHRWLNCCRPAAEQDKKWASVWANKMGDKSVERNADDD